MKKIIGIYTSPRTHWVGDGFPVRTLFSYDNLGKHISPFLLLDHAGPAEFTPTTERRGVGQHPHRGFETVTIVYKGELEHRDSTGSGGKIGPGDVQWMTAASGILHEEFHSEGFAKTGGTLEMVQLWVNLPAKDKMADAGYQTILDADIPSIPLKDEAGSLRLIAGEFDGQTGPAHTFTPIDVWDLRLNGGQLLTLDLHEGRNTALVVLRGTVQVNGLELVREGQLVLLERNGQQISLEANNDAVVLLLSGEPIDEPIVGHGPFVMNSEQEIHQAFADFQSGRFGRMHG
ncbi:quercetin 2,3-dioxygenase [Pseudomonas sp. RIT-PI-q]|uniref:pirin family protein n=1 Tax=Pseudomonas sp. RIT-PI-q TaxID=1690247 RepID=UPI0006CDDA25|nr:pirin family protein [Pseudomonas sp. RIT-PI-q]KPG92167.1 quercetin 2,3-dioxygenase [Pseudomonas sp. RIT-PI-q]